MSGKRAWRARWDLRADDGGALVEFLGVTVLLLVPIVYAVVAVGQVQAASYAVEGASRAAARGAAIAAMDVLDAAGTAPQAEAAARDRAMAAVEMALEDFDVAGEPSVSLTCAGGCASPGAQVTATVEVAVPLPGIPGPVRAALPLDVSVSATGTSLVDAVSRP